MFQTFITDIAFIRDIFSLKPKKVVSDILRVVCYVTNDVALDTQLKV